jgi:hypothetical protein
MRTAAKPNPGSRRCCRAFTLLEVLITFVTAVFVLGGALGAYLYGARMTQVVQPKLMASDQARKAVALVTEDIRAAYTVKVGNRTGTAFSPSAPNTAQLGNALCINPTADPNRFILYFWDSSDKNLKRTTNNAVAPVILASSISNALVFSAEDFKGNILSNDVNNFVIGLNLQFYQIQYPVTAVGAGGFYDWYQLRAKVTRRILF